MQSNLSDSEYSILVNINNSTERSDVYSNKNLKEDNHSSNRRDAFIQLSVNSILLGCLLFAMDMLFHNQLCNIIFNCGCSWPSFIGGSDWNKCNVHNTYGPQCPWCISPYKSPHLVFFTTKWPPILISIITYIWLVLYKDIKEMSMIAISISMYYLYEFICGFLFYICSDYPYFLFLDTSTAAQRHSWSIHPNPYVP
jgi:hypothetical protein